MGFIKNCRSITALITDVTGQYSAYLSEFLLIRIRKIAGFRGGVGGARELALFSESCPYGHSTNYYTIGY